MNYKVEIKNKEFIRKSDKKQFNKTAIVTFSDKEGKETEKPEEYGLIDRNDVYKLIDEGKEINLNQCYIKNFSLKEYRRKFNREYIKKDKEAYSRITTLKKFFANNSFFDCDDRIDFSRGKFEGREVTFFRCCFGRGDVTFFLSNFIDVDLNFQGSKFFVRNLTFHGCRFGANSVFFTKTNFGNSNVSFEGADLKDCRLSFDEAQFGYGEVNFSHAKFGNNNITFSKARIYGNIKFNNCQFYHYINLRFAICNSIELKETIVRDILDLRPEFPSTIDIKTFLNGGIKKINIVGMQNLGRINIDWKRNPIKKLIENQGEETTNYQKAEQFRIFKENFRKIGLEEEADKADTEMRNHKLKYNKKKENYIDKYNLKKCKDVDGLYIFADIRGFSNWCNKNLLEIEKLLTIFYSLAIKYFGEPEHSPCVKKVVKFLGDGFFAVSEYNDKENSDDFKKKLIEILSSISKFKIDFEDRITKSLLHDKNTLSISFGIAYGVSKRFCVSNFPEDYSGDKINLTARLCSEALSEEILIEIELKEQILALSKNNRILIKESEDKKIQPKGFDEMEVFVLKDYELNLL